MDFLSVCLLVVFNAGLVRGQVPDTVAGLKGYLARTEEAYARADYRYKREMYSREGKVEQSDTMNAKLSGTSHVTAWVMSDPLSQPPAFTHVIGNNPRYSFALTRQNDTWVLTKLLSSRHPSHGRYDVLQIPFAVSAGRLTYKSLLERPDTKAVLRSPSDWRGRPHVEWVIDTIYHAINSGEPIRRRYGLFFPTDGSTPVAGIRIYDSNDLSQWLVEEVVQYQSGLNPWPTIKSIETYVTDKTAGSQSWRVSRIEVVEFHRLSSPQPEKEFTLSGYGLPEPKVLPDGGGTIGMEGSDINMVSFKPDLVPTEEGNGRNWWWLLLVIVVAVGGTSYVIYRRRNRGAGVG